LREFSKMNRGKLESAREMEDEEEGEDLRR
jgi:hypothetical protein